MAAKSKKYPVRAKGSRVQGFEGSRVTSLLESSLDFRVEVPSSRFEFQVENRYPGTSNSKLEILRIRKTFFVLPG